MNRLSNVDLEALRAGDTEAFSDLIREHHHMLVVAVRPLVGDSRAEEVVQDVWIKVHKAIRHFEGRSHIKTWLCSIALNEARMFLRRHKREVSLDQLQTYDESDPLANRFHSDGRWSVQPSAWNSDAPETLLMQENLLDCIQKTLHALPDKQRSLLQLRDIEGLPFDTICNELDISASNARVLLHRARACLYTMLENYEETGEC